MGLIRVEQLLLVLEQRTAGVQPSGRWRCGGGGGGGGGGVGGCGRGRGRGRGRVGAGAVVAVGRMRWWWYIYIYNLLATRVYLHCLATRFGRLD